MPVDPRVLVSELNELALADPMEARQRLVAIFEDPLFDRGVVLQHLRANATSRLRQVVARAVPHVPSDGRLTSLLEEWVGDETDEFTIAAIAEALGPVPRRDRRRRFVSDLADAATTYNYLSARLRHRVLNALPKVGLDTRRLAAVINEEVDEEVRTRVMDAVDTLRESLLRLQAAVSLDGEAHQFEVRDFAIIDWIRQFAKTYESSWPGLRMHIAANAKAEAARIASVPYLLETAFCNTFDNARQAVAGECVVNITSRIDRNRLVIRISDNGNGFSAVAATAAFETSFSTYGHQGRGLMEIRDAILRMGGSVRIAPAPDGLRLEITLPITTK